MASDYLYKILEIPKIVKGLNPEPDSAIGLQRPAPNNTLQNNKL